MRAGLLTPGARRGKLLVDVPSGRVPVVVGLDSVSKNVPAWVEAEGLEAAGLRVDVAYGGAFYASVESPLPVEPASLTRLIELGREIKYELEAQREFVVPHAPDIRDVYGVIFWQDEGESDDALVQRNVTVFADGEVDRSPCRSGTSARLALLYESGEILMEHSLLHRSIVGTEFRARVSNELDEGVVTEIEGEAHLTGHHEFVLEPDDELGTGFLLR